MENNKKPDSLVDSQGPESCYEPPIPTQPDAEGLQLNTSSYKTPQSEEKRPYYTEYPTNPRRTSSKRLIIAATALILVVIIGLAVGLGVGLSQTSNYKHATPTTTVTVTAEPTLTTPAVSAVTAGSTGIAAFSCDDGIGSAATYSVPGSSAKFVEECYTDYPSDTMIWNATATNSNETVYDLWVHTTYSFQSCMDSCVQYNDDLDSTTHAPCLAVSYNANLTQAIQLSGGNCWLKNTRGRSVHGGDNIGPVSQFAIRASAYNQCVPEGC